MRPGLLDQRVTIQSRSEVSDGGGGVTRTWADVATVWANVKPKSSREGMNEGRMGAVFAVMFTIRNRTISETDRLVWGGEVYNIRGVMREGGRPLYVTIEAERGVSE